MRTQEELLQEAENKTKGANQVVNTPTHTPTLTHNHSLSHTHIHTHAGAHSRRASARSREETKGANQVAFRLHSLVVSRARTGALSANRKYESRSYMIIYIYDYIYMIICI